MAGAAQGDALYRPPPDRPAPVEQGRGCGGAVRRDPFGRPFLAGPRSRARLREAGKAAAPLRPGQCRRRAADGRLSGLRPDRKSVVEGKRVSVRVELGGRRIIKKNKKRTE